MHTCLALLFLPPTQHQTQSCQVIPSVFILKLEYIIFFCFKCFKYKDTSLGKLKASISFLLPSLSFFPLVIYGSNLFHILGILKEWIDKAQVNILYVLHALSRHTILTDVPIPSIK